MKTILLATDFSPAALNATNYAADIALAINAELMLLHVFQIPVVYLEVPVPVTGADIREGAEKAMQHLKQTLTRKTGDTLYIETEVRMGDFFTELKSVCEKVKPYAVVMGSQGTTATERFLFGTHTVHIMKHLAWPLIAVPAGIVFSSIKKIALACDFNKIMDEINVQEIKTLVRDFNAELYVINTGKQEAFDPEIIFESGLLEEKLAPVKPHFNFITCSDTDEGIIEFADKNNIDLLVVLPRRHSLLDKLIHTSHTKQLVLHSHVPVMAFHQY